MEYDPQAETALKMKQLIERYHADDKCLKQELTRLGTNQSRVKRIFQDLFGESPREYLDSVRFQWVSNRLCVSTDSIMEVAHAAGFNSLSAFYRFFSSQVGIPPARYHREYRRNEKNEDEL
jgi:AraC-like DNA-binding protein